MATPRSQAPGSVVLEAEHFQQLIDVLKAQGYRVAGPAIRDGAIVYDDINAVTDLPVGWYDEQKPGSYRLKKRRDRSYFAYVVGQQSIKEYLHPPVVTLFTAHRNEGGFTAPPVRHESPKTAFLGVRPCDVASIDVMDRVFKNGKFPNPEYCARRAARPGSTRST